MECCAKCGGIMTPDYMFDMFDDSGVFGITPWRCLICGYRTDPVMDANRHKVTGHAEEAELAA